MKLFRYYYNILTESILTGVRSTDIGLQSISSPLPESPPYGFWVDRSGNYKTIASFASGGHHGAAREIIMAAFDAREASDNLTDEDEREFIESLKGPNSLFQLLFRAGYMHIVKTSPKEYVFFTSSPTPANYQIKFLSYLKEKYGAQASRSREQLDR